MAHKGGSEKRENYSRSVGCPTSNFVMVVCKNGDNKYLSLNDKIIAFPLNHSDHYAQNDEDGTISTIVKKKCGINIEVCGILRIEHTENYGQFAEMRCIYYAEAIIDKDKKLKLKENTKWIDIPKKEDIDKSDDLHGWISYLEYENGIIYPMNAFCEEGEPVKIPDYKMQHIANHTNANYVNIFNNNDQSNDNKKDNDEEKEK